MKNKYKLMLTDDLLKLVNKLKIMGYNAYFIKDNCKNLCALAIEKHGITIVMFSYADASLRDRNYQIGVINYEYEKDGAFGIFDERDNITTDYIVSEFNDYILVELEKCPDTARLYPSVEYLTSGYTAELY